MGEMIARLGANLRLRLTHGVAAFDVGSERNNQSG